MKGPPKNTKAKVTDPELERAAGRGENAYTSHSVVAKRAKQIDPVAVVALSESGEILAAREACGAIFGRDPASLVGQNICILLKDGFDNDVGRFLHRHRAGKNPTGTTAMRVLALRKDGSEFLAQVTTLTWNWDTAITKKADVSRLCWTAAFRDLGAPSTPQPRRTSDESRVDGGSTEVGGQRGEVRREGGGERGEPFTPPTSHLPLLTSVRAVLEAGASGLEENAVKVNAPAGAGAPASSTAGSAGAVAEKPAEETVAAQPEPEPSPQPPPVPAQAAVTKVEGEQPPRDDAKSGRTAAQVVALELKRQLEELEGQLRAAASELERVKAESEQRGRGEFELRAQLEAAKEAVGYAEAALREEIARKEKAEERLQNLSSSLRLEQAERSKRFEAELVSLRQERDELNAKLAADQESAGEATRRAAELELRLNRNAAEFERARRELERQTDSECCRSADCRSSSRRARSNSAGGNWSGSRRNGSTPSRSGANSSTRPGLPGRNWKEPGRAQSSRTRYSRRSWPSSGRSMTS